MSTPDYSHWSQDDRDSFDAIASESGLTGPELWQRVKDRAALAVVRGNHFSKEYFDALFRVAVECGETPEKFHREFLARMEVLRLPRCE